MRELRAKVESKRPLRRAEADYWNMVVTTTRVYYRSHIAADWPTYPECRYEWGIRRRPTKPKTRNPNRQTRNKLSEADIRAIRAAAITRGKERNIEALAARYKVAASTVAAIAYGYGKYGE